MIVFQEKRRYPKNDAGCRGESSQYRRIRGRGEVGYHLSYNEVYNLLLSFLLSRIVNPFSRRPAAVISHLLPFLLHNKRSTISLILDCLLFLYGILRINTCIILIEEQTHTHRQTNNEIILEIWRAICAQDVLLGN